MPNCKKCGDPLSPGTCSPSRLGRGPCRKCHTIWTRAQYGHQPAIRQVLGEPFAFPCGCAGVLPKQLGIPTKFVKPVKISGVENRFECRVFRILMSSKHQAEKLGFAPIPYETPHTIIRALMEDPNCERCGKPLAWEFGRCKTPHLHHDHGTGEIYGFTHPICNPRAMQIEIERLRTENRILRGRTNGSH